MVRPLIILEGPDGGGKSTLAKVLERELVDDYGPVTVEHHGPYKGEATIWHRYLFSMLPAYANLATVVLDRAWQAEPIYGAVYRNGANRIESWQRRMLERVALGCGAVLVWCLPSFYACRKAYLTRRAAEMLDTPKQLKAVYDLYAGSLSALIPAVRFDYRKPGATKLLLEWLAAFERETANTGPGIGAWRPGRSILLIGERFGGSGAGRWHFPFVSLRRSGCSAWFAEQLEAGGVGEQLLYWVDAYASGARDEDQLDPGFLDRLRPRAIFALGSIAAEWCVSYVGRAGWQRFDHPQHWKRFRNSTPYPLIQELIQCIPR
jgi:hypothetical protein